MPPLCAAGFAVLSTGPVCRYVRYTVWKIAVYTYPADADGRGEAGHHAEAALLGKRQLVGRVDQHAHTHVGGQQRRVPAGVHVQCDAQTRL